MLILEIFFWMLIGLLYLGVPFPLQEVLIGVSALVIGIWKLLELFRSR